MKTKTKIKAKILLLKIVGAILYFGILSPLLLLRVLPLHYQYPILGHLQNIGIMILSILILAACIICLVKAKDLEEILDQEFKNKNYENKN